MIENQENNRGNKKNYNSELLLKILNKSSIKEQTNIENELYVDENWKINSKESTDLIPNEDSKLKIILKEFFPDKKIRIIDNKDGSQTILIL